MDFGADGPPPWRWFKGRLSPVLDLRIPPAAISGSLAHFEQVFE